MKTISFDNQYFFKIKSFLFLMLVSCSAYSDFQEVGLMDFSDVTLAMNCQNQKYNDVLTSESVHVPIRALKEYYLAMKSQSNQRLLNNYETADGSYERMKVSLERNKYNYSKFVSVTNISVHKMCYWGNYIFSDTRIIFQGREMKWIDTLLCEDSLTCRVSDLQFQAITELYGRGVAQLLYQNTRIIKENAAEEAKISLLPIFFFTPDNKIYLNYVLEKKQSCALRSSTKLCAQLKKWESDVKSQNFERMKVDQISTYISVNFQQFSHGSYPRAVDISDPRNVEEGLSLGAHPFWNLFDSLQEVSVLNTFETKSGVRFHAIKLHAKKDYYMVIMEKDGVMTFLSKNEKEHTFLFHPQVIQKLAFN